MHINKNTNYKVTASCGKKRVSNTAFAEKIFEHSESTCWRGAIFWDIIWSTYPAVMGWLTHYGCKEDDWIKPFLTGGVIVIIGNYTGDRLNFGKAIEKAKIAGIKVCISILFMIRSSNIHVWKKMVSFFLGWRSHSGRRCSVES